MPRPRTGSVYRHGDHWDIQLTLPDGARSRAMCQPPEMSEARARDKARRLSDRATKEALPGLTPKRRATSGPASSRETLADWSERWCEARKERGLTSVKDDRGRLRKWVLPHFGDMPIADVTRPDLERLVEKLDRAVMAGACSWKTAINTWGAVSKMFGDAERSKVLALRARTDNPCAGVRGPDHGVTKSKAYLYPSEVAALLSCDRVPLRWRQVFALTIYTYARPGEVEALTWEDVDLEHRVLHIHRAIDRSAKGKVKSTKTKMPRRIPLEPAILPLLSALRGDDASGRVVRMPPVSDLAKGLRKYLVWAGVKRAELVANDGTRKQITFYDLRATGITWMALRGDDPLKIMQRAGHEDISTTMGYIREADNLVSARGEVFAALPPALLVSPGESPEGPATWANLRETTWKKRSVPSGIRTREKEADPLGSRTFPDVKGEASEQKPTPNPAISRAAGETLAKPAALLAPMPPAVSEPSRTPASPRAALLAHLTGGLGAALAAGDLEAAAVAHEAIGRLLAPVVHSAEDAGDDAKVVDLDAERARRAGRNA